MTEVVAAEADRPIGRFRGEPVLKLPSDLYIPPDALEVFLETFEGPLDLLLYLIRKHNLDVLDIPMAKLTAQYLEYVEVMRQKRAWEESASMTLQPSPINLWRVLFFHPCVVSLLTLEKEGGRHPRSTHHSSINVRDKK